MDTHRKTLGSANVLAMIMAGGEGRGFIRSLATERNRQLFSAVNTALSTLCLTIS